MYEGPHGNAGTKRIAMCLGPIRTLATKADTQAFVSCTACARHAPSLTTYHAEVHAHEYRNINKLATVHNDGITGAAAMVWEEQENLSNYKNE